MSVLWVAGRSRGSLDCCNPRWRIRVRHTLTTLDRALLVKACRRWSKCAVEHTLTTKVLIKSRSGGYNPTKLTDLFCRLRWEQGRKLSPSLSLSLSISLSLSLCHSHSLSLSLSLSVSLSHTHTDTDCLYLTLFPCLSVSLARSLSL